MHIFSRRAAAAACALAMAGIGALPGVASAEEPAAVPNASRRPAEALPAGQPDPVGFIITFQPGSAPSTVDGEADKVADGAADDVGATASVSRRMYNGAAVVRLSRALSREDTSRFLDAVSAHPSVAYVEPDLLAQATLIPNDPEWSAQWHYHEATGGINLPAALDTADGTGTVVAVIDTGRTLHPELDANTLDGYDFITSSTTARDGNGRDADESDQGDWETNNQCGFPARNSSWHATHVAGTIGAVTNNGVGVAGIAPNTRILHARVLGLCGGTSSDIADAIAWSSGASVAGVPANTTPADVINLSLGGSGACAVNSVYQVAINTAVANGTVVVVAAGNSASNAANFSPASCSNIITVASTNRSGARADYSNFGSVVEIAAPGGDTTPVSTDGVRSTLNTGTTVPGSPSYAFYQGTSMATPHVAGVAALVLGEQSMTPAALTTHLQTTARAFPGVCSQCGSGILDAQAAIAGLGGSPGSIALSTGTQTVGENAGTAVLTLDRTGGSTGAVSVQVDVTGGTATNGSDYGLTDPTTVNFANGDTQETVNISITDDGGVEPSETIIVNLINATGGATIGSPASQTVTITDNDNEPVTGTIGFALRNTSAREPRTGFRDVTVSVTRSGGTGAASVNYATTGGTATAGADYVSTSGTLNFPAGASTQTFTVRVNSDAVTPEVAETIQMTLSGATAGIVLNPVSARVTIKAN